MCEISVQYYQHKCRYFVFDSLYDNNIIVCMKKYSKDFLNLPSINIYMYFQQMLSIQGEVFSKVNCKMHMILF